MRYCVGMAVLSRQVSLAFDPDQSHDGNGASLSGPLKALLADRRWDLRTTDHRITIAPRLIDGIQLHEDQYYDSQLASVRDGRIVVEADGWHLDLPVKAEDGVVFSGMRFEEYQRFLKTGRIVGSFTANPIDAQLFATSWQSQTTFDKPSIVVRAKSGGGSKADITDVYIGRAYRIKTGTIDLHTAGTQVTEDARQSPSSWVAWKRIEPGEKIELRHTHRLGLCFTCGRHAHNCLQLDWDESQHPRDESGKFTYAGGSAGVKAAADSILAYTSDVRGTPQDVVPELPIDKFTLDHARDLVAKGARAEDILRVLGPESVKQFVDFFEHSKVANEHLTETLRDLVVELGPQAEVIQGPIKGLQRAVEKAVNKDTGNATSLRDPVRASIAVDTYEELSTAVVALQKSLEAKGGTIIESENKFANPTSAGYRDLSLNVKMPNGVIGEVQLHLKPILDVKNGVGHKIYEEFRKLAEKKTPLTEAEAAKVTSLMEESRRIYDAAWKKAGGE